MLDPAGRQMQQRWLKERIESLDIRGAIASNRWSEGLYVAYWKNFIYLGAITGRDAESVRLELSEVMRADPRIVMRHAILVIFDRPDIASEFDGDAHFRLLDYSRHGPSGRRMWIYRMSLTAGR